MPQVSNDDFEVARHDQNNIKIIKSARFKYKRNIPNKELENCCLIALWKALKKYNPTKGRTFTSWLYIMVEWECYHYISERNKSFTSLCANSKDINKLSLSYEMSTNDEFLDTISILPQDLQEIVTSKILYNKSIKEIGKEKKMDYRTIYNKLHKAYEIIRNNADRTLSK